MTKTSKRMKAVYTSVNRENTYELADAVKLLKENSKVKFDETVDLSINLGIDPKQSDQAVRGAVSMPNGLGKKVTVAVFAKGDKATAAKEAGADYVGAEELAEKIEKEGAGDIDSIVASPDMMAVVGKLGKVLGPRGLMPNPKLGTVTPDVAAAVKKVKSGQVEFRIEKAGIIHVGVGKVSFEANAIEENIRALFAAVTKAKPSTVKGTYLKKVSLSSSMGPGIKLDLASLAA